MDAKAAQRLLSSGEREASGPSVSFFNGAVNSESGQLAATAPFFRYVTSSAHASRSVVMCVENRMDTPPLLTERAQQIQ